MSRPVTLRAAVLASLLLAACVGGAGGGRGGGGGGGGQVPPAATSCTPPAPGGGGTAYHVGPGQQYTAIGDVPWYALQAGDTVYIHYRSTPYHEKLLVSGRGTPTQWIRVLGVPGPNGEKPVLSGDGATTSHNMHHRWQDACGSAAIQCAGVVQVAVNDGESSPLPGYIEIANLQVQDGYTAYGFTAEDGTYSKYEDGAACIYAKSPQHLLVRDNVLTNCGLGFFDWTGDGLAENWWEGLGQDLVLSGNTFVGNGDVGSYLDHQTYTESDGVLIECNHYGAERPGTLGSQIKDRSAGTVIRYNHIEQSPAGWDLDLVEPQEGWPTLGSLATYRQAFVYGNLIVNRGVDQPNLVHWNEDHQAGQGRATLSGGKLFFYDNTVVTIADQADLGAFDVFNVTWGGYDCPPGSLAGVIDVRNNVFASLPRTAGAPVPALRFGYCGQENLAFGRNWVSPGWTAHGATVTGAGDLVSPAGDDPGFVAAGSDDFHLTAASSAAGIGGALAPEVTSNSLGLDLTPVLQLTGDGGTTARSASGAGSDAGAFGR
jgi:hypothetical protein